jgi:hypothetical protein
VNVQVDGNDLILVVLVLLTLLLVVFMVLGKGNAKFRMRVGLKGVDVLVRVGRNEPDDDGRADR